MIYRNIGTLIKGHRERRLRRCVDIADLRVECRRRLPRAVFDYIDGGAETEQTLERNSEAFQKVAFIPRLLQKDSEISLRTSVLGRDLAYPLILAPTGGLKLVHPDGEMGGAKVAALAGVYMTLSNFACTRLEDISSVQPAGPRMFQLYPVQDRDLTLGMIRRAKDAGYDALCITVDSLVEGSRLRDRRNGLNLSASNLINPSLVLDVLLHPIWLFRHLRDRPDGYCNFDDHRNLPETVRRASGMKRLASISWEYLRDLRLEWGNKPFAVKGILARHDAIQAADIGATAIIVSNHGGRQLDSSLPSLAALPAIVDAVGDRVEVILDGGVRRGGDILKAVALGARACMVGRSLVYGLGAGGSSGVQRAIDLLTTEMTRDLHLLGCADIRELDQSYVVRLVEAPLQIRKAI